MVRGARVTCITKVKVQGFRDGLEKTHHNVWSLHLSSLLSAISGFLLKLTGALCVQGPGERCAV